MREIGSLAHSYLRGDSSIKALQDAADATGARMVGNQFGLISALQKLGTYNQRIPTTSISPSTSTLCIVKPLFGMGGASSLFSTHPPLEKRIEVLRVMTVVPKR